MKIDVLTLFPDMFECFISESIIKRAIDKKSIEIDGYFDEDIIGLDAYNDEKYIGKVENILKSPAHDLLLIVNESKHHMVPYINEFIKKIDLDNNKIFINVIEGLIDED